MESTTPLRTQLEQSMTGSGPEDTGLWAWLRDRVDVAQYRPVALPSAVTSELAGREGRYVMLKNPDARTYYRLSDRDSFLWQKMDGSRTVKDLVVAYFLEYKTFAFARVAALVLALRQNRLLVDEPANVYGEIQHQLAQRRPQTRLMRLWAAFAGKQFAIGGLDRWISAAYRYGGRLLFTWPMLILYLLITIAGLYSFSRAFRAGGYGVVQIAGSYAWGAVGLILAYLLSIFLHESSHALTVKHYRSEVRRAGFMLYMGMPGFFVDTTDIWMQGKRARLAVTWAGPYSGLILGGLASIVMVVWPDFFLNAVLFQFAFMTYILVFFNLNPLLELDGYYLLMDSLEIPGLRRKSLAFLRSGLAARLRELLKAGKKVTDVVPSFSSEERVFAVFGVLSAAWTGYMLFAAARYYQSRIARAVQELGSPQQGVGQTILGVVVLLFSALLAAGLALGLWSMARNLVRSFARHGLFRGWRLAATLLVIALVLWLMPGYLGHQAWLPALSIIALAATAVFAAWSAVDTAGSRLAPLFWLLMALAIALALREAALLVGARIEVSGQVIDRAPVVLGLLAAAVMYGAALAIFGDTDIKQLKPWERTLLAAGLAGSLVLVVATAAQLPAPLRLADPDTWLAVATPVASLLFLLVLVPAIVSYWHTGLAPAWMLLALAAAGLLAAEVFNLSPLLAYLLLAAAALAFHSAYARLATSRAQPQATFGLTDVQRLDRALASTVRSLWDEWRAMAGERATRARTGEFNNYALAAGWHVQVLQGEVEQALGGDLSIARRGETYADALTLLLDLMGHEVGEKLTVRAIQRAYDALPWDQREVAAQYLFCHVRRAEKLSQEFRSTQQSYRALLRRIPIFATMEEDELDLLCSQLRVEHYPPGRTIIRQGDAGDRFYIVHRGHVEVTQRDERGVTHVVRHLDRGEYFGEVALLHDAPRNATCRATVPTELLSLSRVDFERLVKVRFGLRDTVDRSVARSELLRHVSLFADLDAYQVHLIANKMREESYEPGEAIIRQGEIGDTFYVIEAGQVETSVRQDGHERVVARRGSGEYVGEIALLMQVPRTATVRALTQVQVLVLDRDNFDRLVAGHLYLSRALERDATRRLMGLRQLAVA